MIVALHAVPIDRSNKPLVDLFRAHEVFDLAIWSAAADRARACDAVASLRAGIERLSNGTELAARLGLVNPVTDLWLADRERPRVSVILDTALMLPTWWRTIRHLIRRLFPSRALLRLYGPAARTSRLALASIYLNRCKRAFLGGLGAIRDVRRAGRNARVSPVRRRTE